MKTWILIGLLLIAGWIIVLKSISIIEQRVCRQASPEKYQELKCWEVK